MEPTPGRNVEQLSRSNQVTVADRNPLYFLPAEGPSPFEEESEKSDDFYELSANDLRTIHRDLAQRVKLETNRPFLPKTYLDRKNREARERAYRNAVVVFSIRNEFIIQAQFFSSEPVSHVFDFLRSVLIDQAAPFSLHFMREKLSQDDKRSLLEAHLAPSARLRLSLDHMPAQIDQAIDCTRLTKVTEHQARQASQNWLSLNSTFQSFESILCDNDIQLREQNSDQEKVKRASQLIFGGKKASGSNNGGGAPQSSSKSTANNPNGYVPKWFKKM